MAAVLDAFNNPIPQPSPAAAAARAAVIRQSQATKFGVLALDMRNPDHREHLTQTFVGAPGQPLHFPATQQVLDALLQQHVANGGPQPTTLFERANTVSATWMPAVKIAYCDILSDGKTIVAGGILTLVDKAQISWMNLQIVDNNSTPPQVIATVSPPAQFDRYTTQIMAQGPIINPNLPINVTCTLTVMYTPVNGGETVTLADTCVFNGISPVNVVTVTDPNNNKHPSRNYIKIGLNRTSDQQPDCDYWYTFPTDGPPKPVIGVQVVGNATLSAGSTLAGAPNFNGYLVLYKRGSMVGGGACFVFPTGDLTPYIKPGETFFSWNIGPDMFTTAPWEQNDTIDLDFFCQFQLVGGGTGRVRVTSIPQVYGGDAPKNIGPINPMVFVWGCLAAQTQIRTPDGFKAIADIRVGDQVMRDAAGALLTVTDHWTGVERKPMLRIAEAGGRDILVTDQHPMSTPAGIRLACDLLVGDAIYVEEGQSVILSIEPVSYDGYVHNLDLGTDDERAGIDADATTMLAQGFVVGDNRMQGSHSLRAREAELERDTLVALPQAWRLDFENSRRRALGLPLLEALVA